MKFESDFDGHTNARRVTILHTGSEFPHADGINCHLIQTQRLYHVDPCDDPRRLITMSSTTWSSGRRWPTRLVSTCWFVNLSGFNSGLWGGNKKSRRCEVCCASHRLTGSPAKLCALGAAPQSKHLSEGRVTGQRTQEGQKNPNGEALPEEHERQPASVRQGRDHIAVEALPRPGGKGTPHLGALNPP